MNGGGGWQLNWVLEYSQENEKRSGLRRVGGLAGSWLSAVRAKVGRLEALVSALSEPQHYVGESRIKTSLQIEGAYVEYLT